MVPGHDYFSDGCKLLIPNGLESTAATSLTLSPANAGLEEASAIF